MGVFTVAAPDAEVAGTVKFLNNVGPIFREWVPPTSPPLRPLCSL